MFPRNASASRQLLGMTVEERTNERHSERNVSVAGVDASD